MALTDAQHSRRPCDEIAGAGGVEVFSWGRNDLAQTGTPSTDESDYVVRPTAIDALKHVNLVSAAGGQLHSAFVTGDGDVLMCGSNESHQLARKRTEGGVASTPSRSAALDLHAVKAVACGEEYTLAIARQGQLLGWGNGECGQLGDPPVTSQTAPRPIRLVAGARSGLSDVVRVSRVAAGSTHVLALTEERQVYSFGLGSHGVLGHGSEASAHEPRAVAALALVGVAAIAAGDSHSVALSADGHVFSWGRGKFGALGHGDSRDRLTPSRIAALDRLRVRGLAAGALHSVALSHKGRVYTWGRNSSGQLGLGHADDVDAPVVVEDSQSWQIVQVAAGARHTLLLSAAGPIYGCGNSDFGQLATVTPSVTTPRCITLPRGSTGSANQATVLAAGDTSFVFYVSRPRAPVMTPSTPMPADDAKALCRMARHLHDSARPVLASRGDAALGAGAEGSGRSDLVAAVRRVFSTAGSMLTTFGHSAAADSGSDGDGLGAATPQLDFEALTSVYDALLMTRDPEIIEALELACRRYAGHLCGRKGEGVDKSNGAPPSDDAGLALLTEADRVRTLLVLLLNPVNGDAQRRHDPASLATSLTQAIAVSTLQLSPRAGRAFVRWLATVPGATLGTHVVRPLQRYISRTVEAHGWRDASRGAVTNTLGSQSVLLVGTLLRKVHEANGLAGQPVPYERFYNEELSEAVRPFLQHEWLLWQAARQESERGKAAGGAEAPLRDGLPASEVAQSVCQVPFLLTPQCKKIIMQGEAMLLQQQSAGPQLVLVGLQNGETMLVPAGMAQLRLHIRVRRDHVLEDTMQQLQRSLGHLRCPLKVTFMSDDGVPEEGVDEGGVSKEFFQLLMREIFLPQYGMFEYNDETREYWFSPASPEMGVPAVDYRHVGTVVGLGINNGVLLDIHFPLVLYKKMLQGTPTLADLEDAQPSLAKGLQAMLEYEGDDFEDVFCQTFEASYKVFDTVRTVELLPGGAERKVTRLNRGEYVDALVEWTLTTSVESQFHEFQQGFQSVASSTALRLFSPRELELLVCGLPHLDFHALEAGTRYEGYTKESRTVRSFWAIVHALSLDEKKRLLTFVTGCARAPMGGLGKLHLLIQRAGADSDRLPTAHTCFNILLIPDYESEAKLRSSLLTAIQNAEGFGLQ